MSGHHHHHATGGSDINSLSIDLFAFSSDPLASPTTISNQKRRRTEALSDLQLTADSSLQDNEHEQLQQCNSMNQYHQQQQLIVPQSQPTQQQQQQQQQQHYQRTSAQDMYGSYMVPDFNFFQYSHEGLQMSNAQLIRAYSAMQSMGQIPVPQVVQQAQSLSANSVPMQNLAWMMPRPIPPPSTPMQNDGYQRGGFGSYDQDKPTGDSKRVPKLKSLKIVEPQDWSRSIQKACVVVYQRLELKVHPVVREDILKRIESFNRVEWRDHDPKGSRHPCFLVQRENTSSKSPFQVQVAGARILAQKIIYAAYLKLDASKIGTWQVQQKCCHPDGTWWCFEPSHLEKCERDHVPSAVKKHPLPDTPHAIFVARNRHSQQSTTICPLIPKREPITPSSIMDHTSDSIDTINDGFVSDDLNLGKEFIDLEENITTLKNFSPEEYQKICRDAGIESPEAFYRNLQTLGSKVGSVRKQLAKLKPGLQGK